MIDLLQLTVEINLIVLFLVDSFHHDLHSLGRVALEKALAWVEFEFFFVAGIPAEAHGCVAIIHNLEGSGFALADDAVSNEKFVFSLFG